MSEQNKVSLIELHGDTTDEIQVSSLSALDGLKVLEVQCEEDFSLVQEIILSAKAQKKKVEDLLTPHCDRSYQAWKALVGERKLHTDPLDEIIKIGGRKNGSYRSELRAEEERTRVVATAQAKAEAVEDYLESAEVFERNGDYASAEALLQRALNPIVAPVKIIELVQPKAKGTIERTNWKFRITDPKLVPDSFKIIDEKAIGALVRVQKQNCNIAGVEVYSEVTCN
jgi:hypothetical protein